MELDFSSQLKEDELLYIFRSLTPEQQMTLLGMVRGVYGGSAGRPSPEIDLVQVLH